MNSRVSDIARFTSELTKRNALFIFAASKGTGIHLLKVGSKRRRTKAELQSQYSLGDLRRTIAEEERVEEMSLTDRVAYLEQAVAYL